MFWDGGLSLHILNLALNFGEWFLALCISHFTHMERPHLLSTTNCIEDWVYPRINLKKRRIFSNSTPMSTLFYP
jgi:hypothetical protein